MSLFSRMKRCEGPDWGYRFTCRTPSCAACRDRHIAAERREALRRFGDASNSELVLVTVILDAVRELDEIGSAIDKGRRDLRNMVHRRRAASPMWAPVEVMAWVETDVVAAEDFPRLGPDRQALISDLIQVTAGMTGPIWMPSIHGIVRLGPGLDAGALRTALQAQWPGHCRINVKQFYVDKPVENNIAGVVNYANKHACLSNYYDAETGEVITQEWEDVWIASYYSWLHEWSRGFQSLRMSVRRPKPRKPRPSIGDNSDREKVDTDDIPSAYYFSVFPMDNTYWRL